MGCLNSGGGFDHWFGNIHLSGPCNRKCYFRIGQHMMALDKYNNLNTWPLPGLDVFIKECLKREVHEVNLTGTNTDPLLYSHIYELSCTLSDEIPKLELGIRTNGASFDQDKIRMFDKVSLTLCSLEQHVYNQMMGPGKIPDYKKFLKTAKDLKINIVLGPENRLFVLDMCQQLASEGIKRINVREPYGQPHIGDPFKDSQHLAGKWYGMPLYVISGCQVLYWDVHYCEVESVNLYANGHVSVEYPITKGHDPSGSVKDQSHFTHGRHKEQWINRAPTDILSTWQTALKDSNPPNISS